MLKIRLSRAWKKNMPFFRVVVTEHTNAAKHWFIEVLGFYDPLTKEFKIKALDKVKTYISAWAQFSPRVERLMKINNISL
jgi:small subunit ribosomal protein S16